MSKLTRDCFEGRSGRSQSTLGTPCPVAHIAQSFQRSDTCKWFWSGIALMENFDVKKRGLHQDSSAIQRAEINLADLGLALVRLAVEVVVLYGDATYLDYALLQAEVCREQTFLQMIKESHHTVRIKTVRPLYRQGLSIVTRSVPGIVTHTVPGGN